MFCRVCGRLFEFRRCVRTREKKKKEKKKKEKKSLTYTLRQMMKITFNRKQKAKVGIPLVLAQVTSFCSGSYRNRRRTPVLAIPRRRLRFGQWDVRSRRSSSVFRRMSVLVRVEFGWRNSGIETYVSYLVGRTSKCWLWFRRGLGNKRSLAGVRNVGRVKGSNAETGGGLVHYVCREQCDNRRRSVVQHVFYRTIVPLHTFVRDHCSFLPLVHLGTLANG